MNHYGEAKAYPNNSPISQQPVLSDGLETLSQTVSRLRDLAEGTRSIADRLYGPVPQGVGADTVVQGGGILERFERILREASDVEVLLAEQLKRLQSAI